jgi:hypothetical protein
LGLSKVRKNVSGLARMGKTRPMRKRNKKTFSLYRKMNQQITLGVQMSSTNKPTNSNLGSPTLLFKDVPYNEVIVGVECLPFPLQILADFVYAMMISPAVLTNHG